MCSQLMPDTEVELIQRCSGHDGTYAVKRETYDNAMKIGRPVFRRSSRPNPIITGVIVRSRATSSNTGPARKAAAA